MAADTLAPEAPTKSGKNAAANAAASAMSKINHEGGVLVSVDDGFAQTKVWCGGLFGDPDVYRMSILTAVRSGSEGVTALDGSAASGWYESNGRHFTAGATQASENTRFDDFHVSDMNRVAIHHALHQARLSGNAIDLVCGLPISSFYFGGKRNADLINRKRQNLLMPVKAMGLPDNAGIKIRSVQVYPQGISAWIDWAVGSDLQWRPEAMQDDSPVAVIDIGGRTTDFAVILCDGGKPRIDQGRSGSVNLGVLDVQQYVSKEIQTRHRLADRLPAREYDRAVRDRQVRLFGKMQDVSEIVEAGVKDVSARIDSVVSSAIGSGVDLAAVLLVGGGAPLFERIVARFPNGEILPDPEFSNARGMYKYAAINAIGQTR